MMLPSASENVEVTGTFICCGWGLIDVNFLGERLRVCMKGLIMCKLDSNSTLGINPEKINQLCKKYVMLKMLIL